MSVIDIKAIEAAAAKELNDETSSAAKAKLKAALKRVADAEQILANAKRELDDARDQIAAGLVRG